MVATVERGDWKTVRGDAEAFKDMAMDNHSALKMNRN